MGFPSEFTITGQYHGSSSDGSATYANKTGQVLEFVDVRNANNGVYFTAFLSSFSQSFTSNWNTEEVLGRMDPISTFKNTTRTISLAWEVLASNKQEAEDNLDRSNQLVNLLYPSYDDSANALAMARPPLIRLKYANLITSGGFDQNGLLGFITSVNWNPVLEMGYFHGGKDIYPKVISLSIEFTVIHERKLGYGKDGNMLEYDLEAHGENKNWPFKTY